MDGCLGVHWLLSLRTSFQFRPIFLLPTSEYILELHVAVIHYILVLELRGYNFSVRCIVAEALFIMELYIRHGFMVPGNMLPLPNLASKYIVFNPPVDKLRLSDQTASAILDR